MICIVCPTGCRLSVRKDKDGKVMSVTGNTCPRGEKYARQEIESPTRTLTGTVRLEGGLLPRLPVITSDAVPKDRIFDVMREINRVTRIRRSIRAIS
jgi:CxxC motif-containing protein